MKKYVMMILTLLVAALAAASCSPPPPPNDGGNDRDVVMHDGQTNPDGVSTPDGSSDAADAVFVEVSTPNCVSFDTPGQRCDRDSDCCSNSCNAVDHICRQNNLIMTPCGNNSDCGSNGIRGVCSLVAIPGGGTAMRCSLLPVGATCDPQQYECPGACSVTTMTCQPAPADVNCLTARGNADCMPGLRCTPDGMTGRGYCLR